MKRLPERITQEDVNLASRIEKNAGSYFNDPTRKSRNKIWPLRSSEPVALAPEMFSVISVVSPDTIESNSERHETIISYKETKLRRRS